MWAHFVCVILLYHGRDSTNVQCAACTHNWHRTNGTMRSIHLVTIQTSFQFPFSRFFFCVSFFHSLLSLPMRRYARSVFFHRKWKTKYHDSISETEFSSLSKMLFTRVPRKWSTVFRNIIFDYASISYKQTGKLSYKMRAIYLVAIKKQLRFGVLLKVREAVSTPQLPLQKISLRRLRNAVFAHRNGDLKALNAYCTFYKVHKIDLTTISVNLRVLQRHRGCFKSLFHLK